MWALYDDLIASVPQDLTVLECVLGVSWTLVRSERGTGIVKTIKGGKKGSGLENITGMPLKRLAEYAKSWNMLEASLGQAALNSAFNNAAAIQSVTGRSLEQASDPEEANAFKLLEPELQGRKVAVIGHFPEIERLEELCSLAILERDPQGNDYPDPACEYLLPEQDYVFITGTAFTNKTMPRLLQLAGKAKVVLVGPSVPISPILYNYGVDLMAGFVILDSQSIFSAVREGQKMNIFKHGGQMVCIQH